MKLIKEIKDIDFGFETKKVELSLREAARAVLINEDGKIALLYVNSHKFYKLPGGGVEAGEYVEDALEREVLEEAGCIILKLKRKLVRSMKKELILGNFKNLIVIWAKLRGVLESQLLPWVKSQTDLSFNGILLMRL
jgi:8-oxo-dGTP pyrophosphatase MutT (NUDIX family)